MDSKGEESSANPEIDHNEEIEHLSEMDSKGEESSANHRIEVNPENAHNEEIELPQKLVEYYTSERSADVTEVELPHPFECLKNQQTQAADDDVIEPEADPVSATAPVPVSAPVPDLDSSRLLPIAGIFPSSFKPRFSKRAADDVILLNG